jgi:predicted esterase
MPDCDQRPSSDCADVAVINTLDGFNVQPRLSIPFDGLIDVDSVSGNTVLLIRLGDVSCQRDKDDDRCDEDAEELRPHVIGIDQVVWDPATFALHVQSAELLDQHTRYALVVTRGIRDAAGRPVEPTEGFRRFRETVRGPYRHLLLAAIEAAHRLGVRERDIVTASVFTSQSTTSILEKIRDQITTTTPDPADFLLVDGDARPTVFPLQTVTDIAFRGESHVGGPLDPPVHLALNLLTGVESVAFGRYSSPNYEFHREFIPAVGTRTGAPLRCGTNEIYFNLFLPPARLKQANGLWPVAIFSHGVGANKNALVNIAATLAAHGIATMAINTVGHGLGPGGTLTVTLQGGESRTFSAGGRAVDQTGDGQIGPDEGFFAASPRAIIYATDSIRQTAADLIQLVEVIKLGVDVDGDGVHDLDPSRIYMVGNSLGANIGTVLLAVEPSVHVGAFSSAGNPVSENRRLGPGGRQQFAQVLLARTPPLLNASGLARLDGVLVGPPLFNENFPLKNGEALDVVMEDGTSSEIQGPVANTVTGAMAIQEFMDHLGWVSQPGNAVAYAPYLRRHPLSNMTPKSVIYQFAKGDQGAPNPNMTAIIRAGALTDVTTYYRHDLAYQEFPTLPKNPHGFMVNVNNMPLIALGAQEQIAVFFDSDGATIIHPDPARFFEVPIQPIPGRPLLPDGLNFIP